MRWILATSPSVPALLLRIGLAVVMFPHGAQKMLGAFGGDGFNHTMEVFTTGMGLPWIVGFLVIMAEFLGSIALFFGFLTRVCAAGIGTVMVGAIVTVHASNGLFMNWNNTPNVGHGYEFHILAVAIAAALVWLGGGTLSVDRTLVAAGGPKPGMQLNRAPS